MGTNDLNGSMNLEQELAGRVSELDARRREREDQMVTLILDRICEGIVSKEAEIDTLMSATKGRCQKEIMQLVEKEVLRSSDDSLWNADYSLRPHGEQVIYCYTGNYWKTVEPAL
jgi:transcription termination factor NusB